jgi:hypothetical protein
MRRIVQAIWNLDLGTGTLLSAFIDHLLIEEIKMDKRDQELLDKQLSSISSSPQGGGIIGLTIIVVFLVGIGIGNILSKSTHANTNYAALNSTAQSSQ